MTGSHSLLDRVAGPIHFASVKIRAAMDEVGDEIPLSVMVIADPGDDEIQVRHNNNQDIRVTPCDYESLCIRRPDATELSSGFPIAGECERVGMADIFIFKHNQPDGALMENAVSHFVPRIVPSSAV